jgi:hypothetical protein
LVTGIVLVARAAEEIDARPSAGLTIVDILAIATAILLFAGLWTPISGALASVLSFWNLISKTGDPWVNILLAAIGAAMALLGPGAWSVDARLFGWKRIDLPDGEN